MEANCRLMLLPNTFPTKALLEFVAQTALPNELGMSL